VFGNSTGGWKGAILGGVICGVLLALGQLIVGHVLMPSVPFYAMEADPDVHILDWILAQIAGLIG
jgi:PTS system ascorbate-specific IIC component